jgi:hypothetical protein
MILIYALIVDNVVINIVDADEHWISQQTGNWVAVRIDPETETFIGVGVGWIYDAATDTFSAPPEPEPLEA